MRRGVLGEKSCLSFLLQALEGSVLASEPVLQGSVHSHCGALQHGNSHWAVHTGEVITQPASTLQTQCTGGSQSCLCNGKRS